MNLLFIGDFYRRRSHLNKLLMPATATWEPSAAIVELPFDLTPNHFAMVSAGSPRQQRKQLIMATVKFPDRFIVGESRAIRVEFWDQNLKPAKRVDLVRLQVFGPPPPRVWAAMGQLAPLPSKEKST